MTMQNKSISLNNVAGNAERFLAKKQYGSSPNTVAQLPHQVRNASSIREARSMLEEEPPKILCLDLQLPDGNGLDLLEEIRRDGNELPVVIISEHYSSESHRRIEQLGAAGLLTRPFALSRLHKLLAELLDSATCESGVKISNPVEA